MVSCAGELFNIQWRNIGCCIHFLCSVCRSGTYCFHARCRVDGRQSPLPFLASKSWKLLVGQLAGLLFGFNEFVNAHCGQCRLQFWRVQHHSTNPSYCLVFTNDLANAATVLLVEPGEHIQKFDHNADKILQWMHNESMLNSFGLYVSPFLYSMSMNKVQCHNQLC